MSKCNSIRFPLSYFQKNYGAWYYVMVTMQRKTLKIKQALCKKMIGRKSKEVVSRAFISNKEHKNEETWYSLCEILMVFETAFGLILILNKYKTLSGHRTVKTMKRIGQLFYK